MFDWPTTIKNALQEAAFSPLSPVVLIAFSAQNILTFTKYKGYDPEVGAYVGRDANAANQAIGIDFGRYPLTPIYTFTLGLDL